MFSGGTLLLADGAGDRVELSQSVNTAYTHAPRTANGLWHGPERLANSGPVASPFKPRQSLQSSGGRRLSCPPSSFFSVVAIGPDKLCGNSE